MNSDFNINDHSKILRIFEDIAAKKENVYFQHDDENGGVKIVSERAFIEMNDEEKRVPPVKVSDSNSRVC